MSRQKPSPSRRSGDVVHWADGGATSLANLVLLCRPHHRLVHQRFRVEAVGEGFVFRRFDGTALDDRAPPWRAGRAGTQRDAA
jgi:hypothetical protein